VFSAIVGESPNQYLINTRVRAAADRLTGTTAPIAQIAFDVGFNDISHFYSRFRDAFGCAPRQWRLRG
jgi:AraC-like DNA-binding protein